MKFFIKILIFFILLINGCYIQKEVVLLKEFNGDGIAVLNFSVTGSFIESKIGKHAADRLTDALFMKNNLRIIDRSQVNNVLIEMDINSPETLSKEELNILGKKLNANYIILGRIVQTNDKEFITSKSKMGLFISFRIISILDLEVVGMASYKTRYKENLFKEIDKAMIELSKKMNL